MGGLNKLEPEYLKRIAGSFEGIGQGSLLAQQLKLQEQQRAENIQMSALGAGYQPVSPGGTPSFSIGKQRFEQIPMTEQEKLKMTMDYAKFQVDLEKTNAQIKALNALTSQRNRTPDSLKDAKQFAKSQLLDLSRITNQFQNIPKELVPQVQETFGLLGLDFQAELKQKTLPQKIANWVAELSTAGGFKPKQVFKAKSISPSGNYQNVSVNDLSSMSDDQLLNLLNKSGLLSE